MEHQELDRVILRLKNEGLGITNTRIKVLSAFYIDKSPELNANEIYMILQKNKMPVSLSTIYSIIYFLCASGVLRVSAVINGTKFYEFNQDQYPSQLVCSRCGYRQKIADTELVELCKKEVGNAGYEPAKFTLFINGLCKSCRNPSLRSHHVQTG